MRGSRRRRKPSSASSRARMSARHWCAWDRTRRFERMPRLGRTEPFRDARGGVRPGSIAEIARVELGGLEQWTMIRGADVGNPLLIMLHGGPGMPETALIRHFNRALEEQYTVVYWEQRGAGKSFSPRTPKETMTIDRFVND